MTPVIKPEKTISSNSDTGITHINKEQTFYCRFKNLKIRGNAIVLSYKSRSAPTMYQASQSMVSYNNTTVRIDMYPKAIIV